MSYSKIEKSLDTLEVKEKTPAPEESVSKKPAIDKTTVIKGQVGGNINTSSFCISNIPQNVSPEQLEQVVGHIKSNTSAGVKTHTIFEGEVKGDITDSVGCMDFSSFCKS